MAQNFVACDRDQELLLPPSLREWLPEGHLAWFVIDAVGEFDLSAFYAASRADGHGRPAHDPAMMVALLLYGYAIGERSSRRLERRCIEDVATRVICANQAPDHTTIARFRQRHATALAELFGQVLALCAETGLLRVGVIAVDGTKVAANAAPQATRDYEQIAREILAEADAVDAAEDERFGEARGDELPPELSTAQGRRGWLREAKRRLDDKRAEDARPIPRSRPDRLREAKRRLEEEHRTECQANAAYEAYRARGRMKDGRRFGRPPDPFGPPAWPTGKINLSDLDSRNVKTSRGWVQGYNAQAVSTEDQIGTRADACVRGRRRRHAGRRPAPARRRLVAPLLRPVDPGSGARRARADRARAPAGRAARDGAAAGVRHVRAARRRGIPTPAVHGFEADEGSPFGGPFFVMDRLPGTSPNVWRDRDRVALERDWEGDRRIAGDLVEYLAGIHSVDVGDLGGTIEVRDFHATIDHWQGIHERMQLVRDPVIEEAYAWARGREPEPVPPRLVHGDYRIGNSVAARRARHQRR
jgi:transposase